MEWSPPVQCVCASCASSLQPREVGGGGHGRRPSPAAATPRSTRLRALESKLDAEGDDDDVHLRGIEIITAALERAREEESERELVCRCYCRRSKVC